MPTTSAEETLAPPITEVIKPWFVYLVRAANGSLYCGISDDPHRRFQKHQSGKGARFFFQAQPLRWCMSKRVVTRARRCARSV